MPIEGDALGFRQQLLVPATATLLFVAMVSSFTPTPLYPLYQEKWGVGDELIGVAFAAYPIAVIVTLVLMGGVSDRFGRRSTLILSLLTLLIAMGVFAFAFAYPLLLMGRALQGVAVALAAGAGAATLMEAHPRGVARGAFVNTFALAVGSAVGPLLAGVLASISSQPLVVPYIAVAVAVLVPLALVLRSREVRPAVTDAPLIKPIRLPRALWPGFSIAGAAILGTNLAMGLFGSFGGAIAATVGLLSEFAIGFLVSIVLTGVAISQIVTRTLRPRLAMTFGLTAASIGWGLAAIASLSQAAWVMFLGAVLIGSGAGMCLMGSAALIGMISPIHRRAEIYSAYLLVAFGALATLSLLAGVVIEQVSISALLGATFVICAILAVFLVAFSRRLLPTTA